MLIKRFRSWLPVIMSMLIGFVVTSLVMGTPVSANHLGNTEIRSMHQALVDEYVCINYVSGDDSSFDQTFTRERGTLYYDTPPTGQANWDAFAWDSMAEDWRIYFYVMSTSCGSLTADERNATPIEISVQESTSSNCPGGTGLEADGVNCAWKDGAYVSHVYGGVTHYDYAKGFNLFNDIYIGNSSEDLWRHTINHEMGHLLGLADGDGTCPQSIMHSMFYGCSTSYPWPQSLDFGSVSGLAAY